ncbi:hypothetical protein EVC45_08925 [Paraburkholderia sp. UYCP14C]|uniref:hypothetical protein n=1 Tax=Paraburkholderia sp. UYCP14C TaxID=2511130 RepID=UPI00101F3A6E|nr:hypothetical protein [Paraburkholderia sp. UYCP14C]RZF30125.1 hypothetical protein EVC45_08925 [Paraburkholderia sp. UYCP14C]
MTPEQRFHSYVTAGTVLIMFYFIQHIVPLLTFTPSVDQLIKPGVTLLSAVGIYKSLASALVKITKKWRWVKRKLLGPSYVNGTWIGKFEASDGEPIYTVEHFEQSLSSLKIRGQAFHADGRSYAHWKSIAETIDEAAGILTYTYICDKNRDKTSFQGIGEFQFERDDESSAPQCIKGYSADLIDGLRSENREKKISENLLSFEDALAAAKK